MPKPKALFNLIRSLSYFEEFSPDRFVCPICLKCYKPYISKQNPISTAHIIPKAAGGRHVTYICSRCNSYLGQKQDKWFGEYFRLTAQNKSILETSQKRGHFKIAGIPVNGNWTFDPTLGFQLAIYNNRNSPATLRALDALKKSGADPHEIGLHIPLLGSEELIKIGFLTAAYLAWFRELGYSFALQSHLEPIRKQILNPEERIISSCSMIPIENQFFKDPLCGIAIIRGEYYLISIIGNICVFLPSVDSQNYEGLSEYPSEPLQYRRIRFFKKHDFRSPVALAIEKRVLVMPDKLFHNHRSGHMIYFEGFKADPQTLFFQDENTIEQLRKKKNVNYFKFDHVITVDRKLKR